MGDTNDVLNESEVVPKPLLYLEKARLNGFPTNGLRRNHFLLNLENNGEYSFTDGDNASKVNSNFK